MEAGEEVFGRTTMHFVDSIHAVTMHWWFNMHATSMSFKSRRLLRLDCI